jgi:hypothetical protein
MDTKRFSLDTALTLIAAYLGLFVGPIDANAINLALPAAIGGAHGGRIATMLGGLVQLMGAAVALRSARADEPASIPKEVSHA